jgi:ribonucrease Y
MSIETWAAPALGFAAGAAVFYGYFRLRERALRAELTAREQAQAEQARREGELFRSRLQSEARQESDRQRAETERQISGERARLETAGQHIAEREAAVNRQLDRFAQRESELQQRGDTLDANRAVLDRDREDLRRLANERRAQIEQLAHINSLEARTILLKEVEQEAARDAVDLARHIIEKARATAEEQSRRILATTIQRYAGRHTFETTTATVVLSGDDMKGRIIGRDGRNIRAFENVTGVTVLVDDTPNAVVLSAFDPVRREIARQAMERLILDGRIHPTRIEEVVSAVTQEMDGFILRKGEEAMTRAGQPPMHTEVLRLLGRLHFRHSFSQNVLEHSVEVAHLCGLMASELGEDALIARRAGLLHDVGKALSHELEGPHALVGADFLKRHGETGPIINAVASHHDEVPHENLFGVLVSAADAISAARPGSRSESMTTYLQRLENLEQIATEFKGVEKAFAVQAGRELRVVVRPEVLDDQAALQLARQLARKIEDQLLYPGQIRVTVVRETRCVEYAK